ncbi:AfsR/SARP family transcriptional regulator [Streptomyces griseiscabiei]|uniref:BTAD domain-containing putative transcriptional regulator n=3 Tax=Streptomyces griseiscabiei TaxID=2993540 RepID=A0ABU4LAJ0_9ACTN|nr:BTAD domain-containing putative transcriptional regulator [Streptomyces griseiscabiei]MBZ3905073.1 tetratricopeptide repeat protein [Streptomyces griseiscabiei]MDX2912008.1 BTAD domain-containing putative transcriptional regulator [Streptomyces griseiscabiei]
MGALVDVDILILGTVELCADDRRDGLGSPKERLALASLAVDAGRAISLDTLIDRLWDGTPPAKARASLHSYVARIRRRLRDEELGDLLTQQAHAYRLAVRPDQVDSHRYLRLCEQARSLADSGDDVRALALLEQAEGLWRGEPLTGLPGLWAHGVRSNLSEKRLAATLTRMAIELRRGHYADLVPDLTALLDAHPTDETVAGQLMAANYGCGRQTDALRVYDTLRKRLAQEYGTAPGGSLARLHRLILRQAPVTELFARPAPTAPAPSTLPSHGDLVGRAEESRVLRCVSPAGGAIALHTVSGMPGVGKTLLAVHTARALRDSYPDAQLFLDLRGHASGQRPLSPVDALGQLLRTLGVPAGSLPSGLDELTSLWRTLLNTRRTVIVLDDATDPEQVRPLLPGASLSLVIVTSRRRLTGLPGLRTLSLDTLPTEDAVALFRHLVGTERSSDTDGTYQVVRLCGHLPLAIEIAAGRLNSRPSWTISHLIQRLTKGPDRLGEIRDGFRAVARAFEMSYHTLTDTQQRVFRLLSLHLGVEFDAYSTAALTGLLPTESEQILDQLLDANLIQESRPELYRFHDLVKEYALTLTLSEDTPQSRDCAVQALITFYVRTASRAASRTHPRRVPLGPLESLEDSDAPPWSDACSARRWLSQEQHALVSAERHSRAAGRAHQAALVADSLAGFLDEEGHWEVAQVMHTAAAAHWHAVGDGHAEVRALVDLGTAQNHASHYDRALAVTLRALDVARATGEAAAEADVLHLLGLVHWNLGDHRAALDVQKSALDMRRKSGDTWQSARAGNNLGITQIYLNSYAEARKSCTDALEGFRMCGDLREQSRALNNLSEISLRTGDRETAGNLLRQALGLLEETGQENHQGRAIIQVNLAETMHIPDELDTALEMYRQALFTFRRLDDRRNCSITLHQIGVALEAAGRTHEAVAHHQRALELAREIGAAHEEAAARRHLDALAELPEETESGFTN